MPDQNSTANEATSEKWDELIRKADITARIHTFITFAVLGVIGVLVYWAICWPLPYQLAMTAVIFYLGRYLWQKRRHVGDIPLYFFLALSLFLAWYPFLLDKGICFSTFHPEWGFVPIWLACLICLAIPAAFWPLLILYRRIQPYLPTSVLSLSAWKKFKAWRERPQIRSTLWLAMLLLCLVGIGGFFLNDYGDLAKKTVLPLPSAQKQTATQTVPDVPKQVVPPSTQDDSDPNEGEADLPGFSTSRRMLTEIGEFTARILFPLIGGITVIVALIFNWLRTTAIMEQTKNTTQALVNSQKQVRAEQFKNAIDHLGSDKQSVVLGGVHALYDLALNYEEYRKQVFEILCSFVREETGKPEYQRRVLEQLSGESKGSQSQENSLIEQFYQSLDRQPDGDHATSLIVIQTIIDKLFRERESRKIYDEVFKENPADLTLNQARAKRP